MESRGAEVKGIALSDPVDTVLHSQVKAATQDQTKLFSSMIVLPIRSTKRANGDVRRLKALTTLPLDKELLGDPSLSLE